MTFRHLDGRGIGAGWSCLEVGAGGGSIALFMSQRVGAEGHVVATDINTDWIAGTLPGNVELCRHDIGIDPLPEAAFDVIHARAVLTFDQLAGEMLDAGLRDAAELRRYRAILALPDRFYPASMALISVWGRRQLA